MKKFRSSIGGWYWRALYVGLTVGALALAVGAPANWG